MKIFVRQSALLALLLLLAGSAASLGVVREFHGSGNTTTAEFEVRAPWLIDWRVNGEYSQALGFEVDLMDARTGLLTGRVLKTKRRGNGVRLFEESGHYRLRVTASLAKWQIKVQEISREDAKLYTPSGN